MTKLLLLLNLFSAILGASLFAQNAFAQNAFPMRDIRQNVETSQTAASLNLALSLIDGHGVARNLHDAEAILNDIVMKKSTAHPQSMEGRIVSVAYVTLAKLIMNTNPHHARELLHHGAVYYGNAEGQFLLGKLMLNEGHAKQAVRWLSLSAGKAHAGAMVDLGRLLFEGKGVQRNSATGLMYLMMSQEGEDKDFVLSENFPDIFEKSTPEEREKAKFLVQSRKNK